MQSNCGITCVGLLLFAGSLPGQEKWQEAKHVLSDHTRWVSQVRFFDGGKKLASAGGDGTVKIWNTMTWKVTDSYDTGNADQTGIAVSGDGKYLASWSINGGLWVLGIQNKKHAILFPDWRHEKGYYGINSIVFSPDDRTIITGDQFGRIRHLDVPSYIETGKLQRPFLEKLDPHIIQIIGSTADRRALLLCGSEVESETEDRGKKTSARIVPGSRFLVWDSEKRKVVAEFKGPMHVKVWPQVRPGEAPRRQAWYPVLSSAVNGKLVYTFDQQVYVFDIATKTEESVLRRGDDANSYSMYAATARLDFKTLAVAEETSSLGRTTYRIGLFDWKSSEARYLRASDRQGCFEFSPDGRYLVCCCSNSILVYDLSTP